MNADTTDTIRAVRLGDRGTFLLAGDPARPTPCEVLRVGKPSPWNIYVILVRYKSATGKMTRGLISHKGFTPQAPQCK